MSKYKCYTTSNRQQNYPK